MKILHTIKKIVKTEVKPTTIQKLEKEQLEKVIGGGDKLWTDHNLHDPGITIK